MISCLHRKKMLYEVIIIAFLGNKQDAFAFSKTECFILNT